MIENAGETSERYVVISSDGHCGADILDYKPYLEARYHYEFDDWAANFHDPWIDEDPDSEIQDPDRQLGPTSLRAPLNWESQRRLRVLEDQGVVGEVLFPNTAPPFYLSGVITAPAPRTPKEYEYRWAGLRAHNRWLADFCADAPGRRAGLAQLFLNSVDEAVAEVRWARDAGLMGVLLPGSHVLNLVNLYYPQYDSVWAACAELDMPVCLHGVDPAEDRTQGGPAALLAMQFEGPAFYANRPIAHLIAAGTFERFPTLKVAFTEFRNASGIPAWLDGMDRQAEWIAKHDDFLQFRLEAAKVLRHRPSEYFERNVFVGGPLDVPAAIAKGVPNLMFGADLPHAEGTWPYTREVLRHTIHDFSDAERRQYLSERQSQVYGFDLDFLGSVAARVGPTRGELDRPLPPEELPRFPEDTRCISLSAAGML